MLQGTASSVGKSLLAAALCRILRQDGYRAAPFKAQNMSNNSFVTRDGGEMGRAQVVQAQAAGVEPHVDMNPILLKPEAEARSQVVVLGRASGTHSARDYYRRKDELWPVVLGALERLRTSYEVVVIEGAGSPAEINLRSVDLVNMGLARAVDAPVLLVGDIDRGGVFAHLVGTIELLAPPERAQLRGLIINKFRGDPTLLENGLRFLEDRTGLPMLGVVPYLPQHGIPEEDSVALEQQGSTSASRRGVESIDVAVIHLPRIANFTDFEPLAEEPAVRLRYVRDSSALGDPDIIILPGTKSTMADLNYLRQQGLVEGIRSLSQQGRLVLGICGGFQMLGHSIRDPEHVESEETAVPGMGLLPVETIFSVRKTTAQVEGEAAASVGPLRQAAGRRVRGYEIHNGLTTGVGAAPPAFRIRKRSGRAADYPDGAVNAQGNAFGTYIHGLFDDRDFRQALLDAVARQKGLDRPSFLDQSSSDAAYDRLADHVRGSLDVARIHSIMGLES